MQGRLSLTAIQETVSASADTVTGENERGETIYASTGNQLSMPRLHRTAAFCGRFRQAGVRLLRRQLRCRGDRGALCREGRKGCGSAACGREKGRRKEGSLRRRRRLGYLRLQRGLGRGGGTHEGIQLPELRRGAALRREYGGNVLPLLRQPHGRARAILGRTEAGFHPSVPARQGGCSQGAQGALQGKNSSAQSLYR